jgi:phosphopantothenoylcysteine synthetase/decarboxylase
VGKKAYQKLLDKELDLIVAQRVTHSDRPFGPRPLRAWVVDGHGKSRHFRNISKKALSHYLIQQALFLAA